MSASAPPARHPRARLLAATLVAIASLTLTACEDGEGLRDEGPSTHQKSAAHHDLGKAKGRPDDIRTASRP
ncbi:hypothetical protein QQM39_18265 [Streptomyces sp. DT2A-34]|uniref:hypothetical protein n=1 Tax=Streptomyces sp. DT2A-34 TaxID=3051182 RepID=UPI00265BF137|nr:hypothetical protein [Streptomyces sp. DT2A-34]MDO0912718.1 hypothetical protein [Streptomyces sp. DT2A-34]